MLHLEKEDVSIVGMAVLAIVLVLAAGYGLVQLSDISAAIAFGFVGGIVALFVWGFAPRIESYLSTRKQPEPASQPVQFLLGGDELLKELEGVEAWCGHFRDIADSIRDVAPTIMALDHLEFALIQLRGEYRGVWTLTRQNEVTMVADQLGKATSALGKRDLERTKAHVEGARQSAKSLIRELKSEQPPSS